jgi:hypothetical protein
MRATCAASWTRSAIGPRSSDSPAVPRAARKPSTYRRRARARIRRDAEAPRSSTTSRSSRARPSVSTATSAARSTLLSAPRATPQAASTPSSESAARQSLSLGARRGSRRAARRSTRARNQAAARSGWRNVDARPAPSLRAIVAMRAACWRSPSVTSSAKPCSRGPCRSRNAARSRPSSARGRGRTLALLVVSSCLSRDVRSRVVAGSVEHAILSAPCRSRELVSPMRGIDRVLQYE